MSTPFLVSVTSQDNSLFDGEVIQVSATASTGELGILARHAPLMADLKPGQVRLLLKNGEEQVIYISGGFIEVQPSHTIILADEAARAADLDEAEIEAAMARAKLRMQGLTEGAPDAMKIHMEVAKLTAQIMAIRRSNHH